MRKPDLEDLLLKRLYPEKRDRHHLDWYHYVHRNLKPEVKMETLRFYGPYDGLEAQYPGLDYNDAAHRMRLGYFPYHRKLFCAFDELRLTPQEIDQLCNWSGTKASKEAYEKTYNIIIRDTTWEGVEVSDDIYPTVRRFRACRQAMKVRGGCCHMDLDSQDNSGSSRAEFGDSSDGSEGGERNREENTQASIGLELSQRLLVVAEARARLENVPWESEWEQWLKEAAERDGSLFQPSNTGAPTDTRTQTPVGLGHHISAHPHDTQETAVVEASLLPSQPQHLPRSLHSEQEPM